MELTYLKKKPESSVYLVCTFQQIYVIWNDSHVKDDNEI